MAHLLRRWRAPLVGGIAIWLLSFPLLTWHPASASHPVYADGLAIAKTDSADYRLLRQLVGERVVAVQVAAQAAAVQAAAQAAADALAASTAGGRAAPAV